MGRRVREVMTLEVVTVGEQASFKETAATMAEHRVSALPVLDVQGRVAGIAGPRRFPWDVAYERS